ncbi:MAG: arginine repressor [Lachnospiraceae bacterium]|nr:arginine repressor [Lachnospiraceae bacterium]
MKNDRHEKILEIITKNAVETQEELAERLREAGFAVTQATVSRDIKQLHLVKVAGAGNNRQHYAQHGEGRSGLSEKYIRVFRDGVVSMDLAMNILVVKTVSGMAMAVAAAMDAMELSAIVGTIAGDDTIMCAVRSVEDAQDVIGKLNEIWKK